ncbi:LysR family transcriptional regulator [Achromobacter denitrificans]
MSMSIRAMQCFVAVVSTGSISRAAAALHVAQPALSLLMRNLEEDLGVVLLHRSARGVAPTAAGARLLAHAREILGRIDAARADVREDLNAPRGAVSLAMSMSMAKLLTVPLLRFSLKHWPGVYLKIIESSTGYIPGFVSSGHADLGLTFSDEASVDLRFQHLIDEELVVVSPPAAKSRSVKSRPPICARCRRSACAPCRSCRWCCREIRTACAACWTSTSNASAWNSASSRRPMPFPS